MTDFENGKTEPTALSTLTQKITATNSSETTMQAYIKNKLTQGNILGVTHKEFEQLFGGDVRIAFSIAKHADAILGTERFILNPTFLENLIQERITDPEKTRKYLTTLRSIEDPIRQQVIPFVHPALPVEELLPLQQFGKKARLATLNSKTSWRRTTAEPTSIDLQKYMGINLQERIGINAYPCSKEILEGFVGYWERENPRD